MKVIWGRPFQAWPGCAAGDISMLELQNRRSKMQSWLAHVLVSKTVTPDLISAHLAGCGSLFIQDFEKKKKSSCGNKAGYCVRQPVCLSARMHECGKRFFFGISSRYTCIFIPIHTSSYLSTHSSFIYPSIRVLYLGLPRQQGNQQQTGVLLSALYPRCLRPHRRCSPAVRGHS